jgi:hypothetical protein
MNETWLNLTNPHSNPVWKTQHYYSSSRLILIVSPGTHCQSQPPPSPGIPDQKRLFGGFLGGQGAKPPENFGEWTLHDDSSSWLTLNKQGVFQPPKVPSEFGRDFLYRYAGIPVCFWYVCIRFFILLALQDANGILFLVLDFFYWFFHPFFAFSSFGVSQDVSHLCSRVQGLRPWKNLVATVSMCVFLECMVRSTFDLQIYNTVHEKANGSNHFHTKMLWIWLV